MRFFPPLVIILVGGAFIDIGLGNHLVAIGITTIAVALLHAIVILMMRLTGR